MQFSTVLLVDDEQAHTTLVERNLRRIGYTKSIVKLGNGQDLIDWLDVNHTGTPTSGLSPCILLDINMPIKNGIETLAEIKNSDRTRHIPVIMLSTSDNPEEIDSCYKYGCNAYMVKPALSNEFKEKIRELGLFLNTVCAPHLH